MTRFLRPSSSSSSLRFIDAALSTAGPYSLSYTDKRLKWVIREHILCLIKEFPSLAAGSDNFVYGDGTRARLLCVHGILPLSRSNGEIEINIKLHQSYPFVPPFVYLSSPSSAEIDWSSPLIDASTKTASTPYLKIWEYPKSNLLDLVRNLVKLFKLWPPFLSPRTPQNALVAPPPSGWASLVSKREAIDRLYVSFNQDLAIFRATMAKETESLEMIKEKLKGRAWVASKVVEGLVRERERLCGLVEKMEERADAVQTWVEVNSSVPLAMEEVQPEEFFQAIDQKSMSVLDNKAEDLAIDDLVEALDFALKNKAMELEDYVKQVRKLFRKQFSHVAVVHKMQPH